MRKVPDIFQEKDKTFSFELFPPKTEKGYQNLLKTVAQLVKLNPDYISVTYGAGGSSRDKTFDIVQTIQDEHQTIGVAHLTCVLSSKEQIKDILSDIQSRKINNVLALRGDPPQDQPDWTPGPDNFHYSSELVAFIRKHFGNAFGIGVAGFPEGHLLCPDRDKDADFLKIKIDSGADFVVTQLFFDNQDYFDYIKRLQERNVKARIIPGVLPITNYQGLVKFCGICGATVTDNVKEVFEPIQDDPEATLKAGIDFCVKQCKELLAGGAPGIHFYTLNKIHPVDEILRQIR